VNAGVSRIYYAQGYPDEYASQILAEAGIPVERVENPAP
jgi:deoxycytidylate deaminase